jgi:hypothetical protein
VKWVKTSSIPYSLRLTEQLPPLRCDAANLDCLMVFLAGRHLLYKVL